MKFKRLREVDWLVGQRLRLLSYIKTLNEINGGEDYGIPSEVLEFVNRNDAAKGLMTLAIPALAEIERRLNELGVDLSEAA